MNKWIITTTTDKCGCSSNATYHKSIFENIFIKAIEEGENKDEVLKEIELNIFAHNRVISCTEFNISKLQKKLEDIKDDIKCLEFQKEAIEGSL